MILFLHRTKAIQENETVAHLALSAFRSGRQRQLKSFAFAHMIRMIVL